MITAFNLAGFFAAHAIWCISDADSLIPILGSSTVDGKRDMARLAIDDAAAAVAFGKRKLEENDADATDAVLIYDGRIPLGDNKIDALILEVRAYFSPGSEAVVAIPYSPKSSGKFRVHRPKVLRWQNCDDFELDSVFESFFEGVAQHEKGAKIWNDALDESK